MKTEDPFFDEFMTMTMDRVVDSLVPSVDALPPGLLAAVTVGSVKSTLLNLDLTDAERIDLACEVIAHTAVALALYRKEEMARDTAASDHS